MVRRAKKPVQKQAFLLAHHLCSEESNHDPEQAKYSDDRKNI